MGKNLHVVFCFRFFNLCFLFLIFARVYIEEFAYANLFWTTLLNSIKRH